MRTITVVYHVRDDHQAIRHHDPDGMESFRVVEGDAVDALRGLLPFVEAEYYPDCATPEFKDAMINALCVVRPHAPNQDQPTEKGTDR